MHVYLPIKSLKAALGCVADRHEPRAALKGVLIDTEAPLKIVATNGHVLFVAHSDYDTAPMGQIIIPAEIVKQALKSAAKRNNYLQLDAAPNEWRLGELSFRPIEASYPNYVRAIPSTISGKPGQFNPAILLKAWKAMETVGGEKDLYFHTNGPKSAGVYMSPAVQALALVMPRHGPNIPAYPGVPSWVSGVVPHPPRGAVRGAESGR
ncbi:MAG: hypothetical protein ACRD98_00120 [Nitrososphaera sp.]